jgi:hypothetical protein
MIKSQLLCQLSYAPACKGGLLRGIFIIALKNRPYSDPRDAALLGDAARMQPTTTPTRSALAVSDPWLLAASVVSAEHARNP